MPTGTIAFDVSSTGILRITSLVVGLGTFKIGNASVTNSTILNAGPAFSSAPVASDGTFTIAKNTLLLSGSGLIDGILNGLTGSPAADLKGQLTDSSIVLSGVILTSQGVTVEAAPLFARFNNVPPLAVISGLIADVECSEPGGSTVRLSASNSTDLDGFADITNFAWFEMVGGQLQQLGGGEQLDAFFPLGAHEVVLVVQDSVGHTSSAIFTFTVRNTTAPTLSIAPTPACLWAPNHKMVLFELGKEVLVSVRSVCDPAPTFAFCGGCVQDNQPFLGGGQGNTTPDFLCGSSAVCLRSERQGTVKTPRIYTLCVTATDQQGNTSTARTTVNVAHSQQGDKCSKVDSDLLVEDDDPRCTAGTPAQMFTPGPMIGEGGPPSPGGCASVDGTSLAALGALAAALWRRSRRSGRTGASPRP